jgi:hypothetical protein
MFLQYLQSFLDRPNCFARSEDSVLFEERGQKTNRADHQVNNPFYYI